MSIEVYSKNMSSDLYYKHFKIVNDNSSVINKF